MRQRPAGCWPAKQADPMDGLLVIDKARGWTSHDVVARVRRLTGVRRVGHGGTLDPLASGVLPIGIGRGTRVLEYLGAADKRYTATIRLGVSTDTYDADGAVTATHPWQSLHDDDVRAALFDFIGEIEQRPPIYSAIKQEGVPLHRLARAHRAAVPPPRRVTIYALTVLEIHLPDVTIAIHCSKGTYIRSLAHDLGERLGCGAHLTALRRTAAGDLVIGQALTLDQWEAALADGSWPARLLPLDIPLLHQPAAIFGEHSARRVCNGVAPDLPAWSDSGGLCRAYTTDGAFLGVLRSVSDGPGWQVEKVLVGRSDTTAERN
jgi:tRNA pseudouridine55 synthase